MTLNPGSLGSGLPLGRVFRFLDPPGDPLAPPETLSRFTSGKPEFEIPLEKRLESGSYEIEFDTVEYDRDTKEIQLARLRLRTDEKGDKFMDRLGTNKDRPIFVQMESVEVKKRTEPCLNLLGTKKTIVMGGPPTYSW